MKLSKLKLSPACRLKRKVEPTTTPETKMKPACSQGQPEKPEQGNSRKRTIRFEYEDAKARAVFLAGSFNNWDPRATQIGLGADGIWDVELSLAPGRYEYLFVVDERWTPDPKAADYASNPFGGCNSVLHVE